MAKDDSSSNPAASGNSPGTIRPNPGDDAPPGTPGTGEDVCPRCAGTGKWQGQPCENCGGTGMVTKGIAGG
jgi:DnaJ-class molecular chaperone